MNGRTVEGKEEEEVLVTVLLVLALVLVAVVEGEEATSQRRHAGCRLCPPLVVKSARRVSCACGRASTRGEGAEAAATSHLLLMPLVALALARGQGQ
jgi:hypothetical protein